LLNIQNTPPRENFRQHNLESVLIRVDYPLHLRLQNQDPIQFQEAIQNRFPIYQRQNSRNLQIQVENNEPPALITNPMPYIHRFSSAGDRMVVELVANNLTLTIAGDVYTGFDDALAIFNEILGHANRLYQFPVLSRVGLRKVGRYIEAGDWNQRMAEKFSGLFNPALTGTIANPQLGFDLSESTNRTSLLVRENMKCNLQYGVQHGINGTGARASSFFLDLDCFTERPTLIDGAGPFLIRTNEALWDLYNWAITEDMRRIIRGEPINV
jgi:uncharacterized protein (TIGR04255 family)